MKRVYYLSTVIVLVNVFLSSCYFNPSMMLKTKRDYEFTSLPDSTSPEYVISPNDLFTFRLLYNDGFKLIDLSNVGQSNQRQMSALLYLVEFDGKVKLPLLRRIEIAGKTIRQAELMLEEMYAAYYVKPFAIIKVLNRRVIIFPGNSGGDAEIISLANENTTLMEALAQAGGLRSSGKAKKIKVIRENPKNKKPDVYLIDLSTIDGLEQAKLILQANDIIYVEPVLGMASKAMENLSPYLSLLSTTILLISLFGRVATF